MSCRQPIRISPLSAAAAEEAAGAEVLVEAVLEAAPPQAARLKAIPTAITKDTMRFIVFSP